MAKFYYAPKSSKSISNLISHEETMHKVSRLSSAKSRKSLPSMRSNSKKELVKNISKSSVSSGGAYGLNPSVRYSNSGKTELALKLRAKGNPKENMLKLV